ncbi:hypothetical protein KFK09_024439 [Dendrobium nobile]|uniref:Ty3-gypsy retrotransposon protein n=1 Tax=Dendrobium nobile TaxID=94219 RepID=A0A8T3AD26_DENNO|nr:hypothetical protein KFK09_024439 [Dendrobium nobile]
MPRHRCKDRTLQVLTIYDDEETEGGESGKIMEEEEKLHLDVTEVSPNSIVVFTLNHTMKVKREVDDREVVVLNDTGETHNFISNQIVDLLGVKLVDIGVYGVIMGTRKVKMAREVCRGVVLTI